jgi:hypothetical protein
VSISMIEMIGYGLVFSFLSRMEIRMKANSLLLLYFGIHLNVIENDNSHQQK